MRSYAEIAFTPSVRRHQEARGAGASGAGAGWPAPAGLGPEEVDFLRRRDSFYLASVGEGGWPYVQHRGGPAGFLAVLGPSRIGWAERTGNRQYVTAGNLDRDGRVAIIAVDYPGRRRLKLYGVASLDLSPDDELVRAVAPDGRIEGVVTIAVCAYDWNCPKLITPRFTAEEVRALSLPLTERIAELEAEVLRLRED